MKMEKSEFDFWQDHSPHYLDMAFRRDRRKTLKNPDGHGKRTGSCGDTAEIFLIVRSGRIRSVFFDMDGCMNLNACCNTVAHLAEGKTIEEAWKITPDDIVNYLETLPPENTHCAELTAGAFYLALTNYYELKKTPWKRLYRGN